VKIIADSVCKPVEDKTGDTADISGSSIRHTDFLQT
jgi:hypothetical protein